MIITSLLPCRESGPREVKWLTHCHMANSQWQTWHQNPHNFLRTSLPHTTKRAFFFFFFSHSTYSFSTMRSNHYGSLFLWAGQFIPLCNLPQPAWAAFPSRQKTCARGNYRACCPFHLCLHNPAWHCAIKVYVLCSLRSLLIFSAALPGHPESILALLSQ